MNSRYWLSLIALVAAVLLVLVFWSGPRSAQGAVSSFVVLSHGGPPDISGGITLMDANTGDIWFYSGAALEGTAPPTHWGKLVLGQPVARSK